MKISDATLLREDETCDSTIQSELCAHNVIPRYLKNGEETSDFVVDFRCVGDGLCDFGPQ